MEHIKQYENGLRLVVKEIPGMLSAACGVYVNVGSGDESLGANGISHLTEHMLFKGTEKRTAFDISDNIDRIGAQINAYTSKEITCYYTKCIAEHVEACAEILSDIFFNSTFLEKELEREKNVILEEISMCEDTPDELVSNLIMESYFDEHKLGYTILGKSETVSAFKREDIIKHMQEYYNPGNVAIVFSGKIDFENAQRHTEKYFLNNFKNKAVPAVKPPLYKNQKNFKCKFKEIEQANICLACPSLHFDHENMNAYSLLNGVLGSGMSSRLFQKIREKEGLAYSIFSYIAGYKNNGVFTVYAGVNHDKTDSAIKYILEEFEIFKEKGITLDEFNRGKEQLKSALIFGQESATSLMNAYGKYLVITDKLFSIDKKLQDISNLSYEKVNNLCYNMIDLDKICASYVGKGEYAKNIPETLSIK